MKGKIPPRLAAFSVWATTLLWAVVSAFGAGYSLTELRDVHKEWSFAKKLRNGRRLVAQFRMRTALCFAAGFGVSTLVGVLATLGLFVGPTAKKRPDVSAQAAVLRLLLNLMLVAFLLAKRNQRLVRKRLEALADLEGNIEGRIDSLHEDVEDTRHTAHDIRDRLDE